MTDGEQRIIVYFVYGNRSKQSILKMGELGLAPGNVISQAADKITLTAPVKQQPQQHCLRQRGQHNNFPGGTPPFTYYFPPEKKVSNYLFT